MKKSDARLLIAAVARAVKQRFTQRDDHDDLVRRVEKLEAALANLRKQAS